jgi:GAF domain-containing protein
MERIPLGERLSGWVAATGQSILNSDARLDLDSRVREQSPLRSALAVPVEANGRTSGVLSFYAAAANAFDERHKRLVEAAARVMGDTKLIPTASRNGARMSQNGAARLTSMSATVR